MTLSINDFAKSTAYPCGNKKECQSFLKEVPELKGVKMCSIRDTLKKGSKSVLNTKEKLNTY